MFVDCLYLQKKILRMDTWFFFLENIYMIVQIFENRTNYIMVKNKERESLLGEVEISKVW